MSKKVAPQAVAQTPSVYRVTYSNVRTNAKSHPLHQVRDGTAFCELAAAFMQRGYAFGTTIHLYRNDLRQLDAFPRFQRGDVLVMTTRPPLNDADVPSIDQLATQPAKPAAHHRPRKTIEPNNSQLEKLIFTELRRYFAHCDRKFIELTPHAARLLGRENARFAHFELHEYHRATVMKYHHKDGATDAQPPPRSIGFLFRFNNVANAGWDVVVNFGMCGYTNLVWNRIVRTRHPDWLREHRFLMAGLCFKQDGGWPPAMTPEFADDPKAIEVEVLASEKQTAD